MSNANVVHKNMSHAMETKTE